MKRCFFFLPLLLTTFCSLFLDAKEPTVLVTLPPYKHLVERIAHTTVQIEVLVPQGVSPHTYAPNPGQIIAIGKSDLWFRIGESAEEQAARAILSHHPQIEFVDLRRGIDLIGGDHAHCCGNHHDPHIWLSPRLLKRQVETMTDALIRLNPGQEDFYLKNTRQLIGELSDLDADISRMLNRQKGRTVLVAHPAFGYFCRDYNLVQLAIEHEGKDPLPRRLTTLIREARRLKIQRIFAQPQHSIKGAEQIAHAIGAKVVVLDPNKEEVLENLREIAHDFSL